jgi:DNA invertase Pin-like site-specific DNA recombinase
MNISADGLRKARARYRASSKRQTDAQAELHAAIRQAATDGMTVRAIAAEVGLSHQRVAQIVKEGAE